MQEQNTENLDKILQNILKIKNMSLYKNNYDYFLFDNEKINTDNEFISEKYKKVRFLKVENFFSDVEKHRYTSINIDKDAKSIFNELYINTNETERDYLVKHYYYFMTFDQMFAYLVKNESKSEVLHFVTHCTLKGQIRKIEKEEKFLKKIYDLEPDNFYENILCYLNNHARIYKQSIYRTEYQSMLKNLLSEYLPEKRKDFANFTGDSQKKYLNEKSILYEEDNNKCEILISFNKTFIEENFVPDKLKEKHEIGEAQNKFFDNLESLIKSSRKLNLREVVRVHALDKELITCYITKEKNDITKHDIVSYVQSCLSYWKENIIELKDKPIEEMIKIVEANAEIVSLYKNLENKYQIKNQSEKKVKI